MQLKFYRKNPDVQIPTFGTSMSACFDLRYCPTERVVKGYDKWGIPVERPINEGKKSFMIYPGDRLLVPTGLIFRLEDNTEFLKNYSIRIHPRSGMALKRGLTLANAEGVVDADYQEEVFVILMNICDHLQYIELDERIAQAEVVRNENFTLIEVASQPDQHSERSGGFGSTGTK